MATTRVVDANGNVEYIPGPPTVVPTPFVDPTLPHTASVAPVAPVVAPAPVAPVVAPIVTASDLPSAIRAINALVAHLQTKGIV